MVSAPKVLHDASGGVLCLDFVNTLDRMVVRPSVETLESYDDLVLWSRQAGTLSQRRANALARVAEGHPARARHALEHARTLRENVHRVFARLAAGKAPRAEDLDQLNAELAAALTHARLVGVDDAYAWGWEETGDLEAPLWPIAGSAADLLVSPERELVRECAGTDCRWLFLDGTKNHGRRWCSMKTCGNRAKVKRHRERNRPDA